MRYVGLLRGINLGPNRRIPMPELRKALADRGYGEVRTLIASGNLVLDSDLPEEELALDLAKAIEEEFGLDVPVVVRTGEELAAVLAADPFGKVATDPSRYSVTFLPEPPAKARIRELPPAEGGQYSVRGRELYLWMPDGMSKSPMGKWSWDRLLGVAGTNRNWNTVGKLAEMAR
ncbi:DUF1697 domain-containing protein [Petropleomorpha daqingensis]|uniref:Uncharacterized protein (DUF1697 family) n=1 Tax=Petropleomorpha daqingensis TaxID=2026353 RepID=A0A853CGU1_9ACTN|nr:uncharacterized protein (DUF1697 family) [Petropleomorpha daqingensis]